MWGIDKALRRKLAGTEVNRIVGLQPVVTALGLTLVAWESSPIVGLQLEAPAICLKLARYLAQMADMPNAAEYA